MSIVRLIETGQQFLSNDAGNVDVAILRAFPVIEIMEFACSN